MTRKYIPPGVKFQASMAEAWSAENLKHEKHLKSSRNLKRFTKSFFDDIQLTVIALQGSIIILFIIYWLMTNNFIAVIILVFPVFITIMIIMYRPFFLHEEVLVSEWGVGIYKNHKLRFCQSWDKIVGIYCNIQNITFSKIEESIDNGDHNINITLSDKALNKLFNICVGHAYNQLENGHSIDMRNENVHFVPDNDYVYGRVIEKYDNSKSPK